MFKIKRIFIFLIVGSLLSGCSSNRYEPGPAETAGRFIDNGFTKMKDATVQAYRSSRRWVAQTGERISRGSSAFADEWSNKPREHTPYDQRRERKIYKPDPNVPGSLAQREPYDYGQPRKQEPRAQEPRAQEPRARYKPSEPDNNVFYPEGGALSSGEDFEDLRY